MSDYVVIRPRDDKTTRQVSDWCDELIAELAKDGHTVVNDVDDTSPADTAQIDTALGVTAKLVCYFGHGNDPAWLTRGAATIDNTNVKAAAGKAVVSIACKTGRNLGPDAVTSGVVAWLGFDIRVPVLPVHQLRDPIGETLVGALRVLGKSKTMAEAPDAIETDFDKLVDDYDTGPLSGNFNSLTGYLAALSLRDHVALTGSAAHAPL